MRFLIRATSIITSDKDMSHYENGFIAIENGIIIGIGEGDGAEFINASTQCIDYNGKTVLPGFIDTHCFFTGYALSNLGTDLSDTTTYSEIANALKNSLNTLNEIHVGRNLPVSLTDESTLLEVSKLLSDAPILIFYNYGETCWLNQTAQSYFGIQSGPCHSESLWPVLKEMMRSEDYIVSQMKNYMTLLNSRGVTSVKEMAFDDGYGLPKILSSLERRQELTLRVDFMSQPVSKPLDLETALAFRTKYTSDYLKFSGFNRMTDGSISQFAGDLKKPYQGHDFCCSLPIQYDHIRTEVLKADSEGFRFSLHAQGDAAVAKCIDIFSECQRDSNGRLENRHCITDLELTDPYDLERMGWLGVVAEIYPQIPSLYTRVEKLEMINAKIGSDRGKNYWNRRKMADSNVVISCATDLPLLVDDIPESIFHACGAFFEDDVCFNPENAFTMLELLKAWTYGGAYNLGVESKLGSLEIGKLADITILDNDLLTVPYNAMKHVKVYETWQANKGCIYHANRLGE